MQHIESNQDPANKPDANIQVASLGAGFDSTSTANTLREEFLGQSQAYFRPQNGPSPINSSERQAVFSSNQGGFNPYEYYSNSHHQTNYMHRPAYSPNSWDYSREPQQYLGHNQWRQQPHMARFSMPEQTQNYRLDRNTHHNSDLNSILERIKNSQMTMIYRTIKMPNKKTTRISFRPDSRQIAQREGLPILLNKRIDCD